MCIDRLSISWRKSIRKALHVPARTHSVYLPLICECLSFECSAAAASYEVFLLTV